MIVATLDNASNQIEVIKTYAPVHAGKVNINTYIHTLTYTNQKMVSILLNRITLGLRQSLILALHYLLLP